MNHSAMTAEHASRFSLRGLTSRVHNSEVSVVTAADPTAVSELVRRLVGQGWVEEVLVEGDPSAECLGRVVDAARQAGRGVRLQGPSTHAQLPPALGGERWVRHDIDGLPAWRLVQPRPPQWQLALKRALDVTLAAALLVVTSPLLVAIGLAVRLSSPGPALYPWRVVGRHGRPFTGYKFRTMVQDADAAKAQLLAKNEMRGPVFKMANDPRVTPLGRWLRKYSLDELPQLWSVLKGDMSLVGPRPAYRSEYERFELWQMRKLSVTPGLTCLWQVRGRNRIRDFEQWARLDLEYVDRWSLSLDLKIIAQTAVAIFRGTGY